MAESEPSAAAASAATAVTPPEKETPKNTEERQSQPGPDQQPHQQTSQSEVAEIESPTSNWWGSWYSSAKSKSSYVLEAVKKDLDELSTAVRTEVTNAGSAIGETFKIDEPTVVNVKKSLSSFFGQVTDALIPSLDIEDGDDDAEVVLITSDGQVTLTGFQKHLAQIQEADETYLEPPSVGLLENYKRWMEIVEQDQFTQNRLAKHLASSQILNEKYLSLVPDKVSHMEFWQRYLFKRALLEDALANAELAERKAREAAAADSAKTMSPLAGTSKAIIVETEPKKTLSSDRDADLKIKLNKNTNNNNNNNNKTNNRDIVGGGDVGDIGIDDKSIIDGKDESIAQWVEVSSSYTEEISEEEQARLLQEYEMEIRERELNKSAYIPLEEKLRLEKLKLEEEKNNKSTNKTAQQQKKSSQQKPLPSSSSSSSSAKKSTSNINSKVSPTKSSSSSNKTKNKDETNSDESWENV